MKVACVLLAFDRPNYLKQTIKSVVDSYNTCRGFLKNNNIVIDFYLLQDGLVVNGEKKGSASGVKESTKIINSYKNKIKAETSIQINKNNMGIAKQKYKANALHDKYEKIIFFEDDMVVSPYYLQILMVLSKRFPNCAVTACDRTGHIPKNNHKDHLHKALKAKCHYWGYLMPRHVIQKVQPTLKEYIEIVGDDYKKRPGEIIRKKFNVKVTSHDAIINKAMIENDMKRVAAYVPRARYIGENGMHANPKWFEKYRFNIQKPYIFDEDKYIKSFELI